MASALYRTGVTKTLFFSGTMTLHNCGAKNVASGWQTPNGYISPSGDLAHFSNWQATIGANFGGSGTLSNGQVDPGDEKWVTNITIGPLNQGWTIYSDGVSTDNPPPTDIFLTIQCTLQCEEWAVEWYSNLRPARVDDATIEYFLRPLGKVQVVYTSSAGGGTFQAEPNIATDADRGIHLNEYPKILTDPINEFGYGGTISGTHFMGATPTSNWIYASASSLTGNFEDSWSGDGGSFTSGSRDFGVLNNPIETYGSVADYDIPVTISLQDAALQPIKNIRIYPDYFTGATEIINGYDTTIRRADHIHPVLVFADLVNNNYRPDQIAVIKEGSVSDALTLDKSPSLQALDFTQKTWSATDCSSSVVGGHLVVTASGANPKIERDLVNDLMNIASYPAGPDQWFVDNAGSLPGWVNNWKSGNGGPSLTQDGGGHWSHVRRKLLNTSDIFNWSTYRYAYLTGSADQECDIQLVVHWNDLELASEDNNILTGGRITTYTIHLSASTQTLEIDLPGMADATGTVVGTDGLQCVTHIEVTFPTGRTINLQTLVLKEKSRPVVDVHQSGDTSAISALTDGKHTLFTNANNWNLRNQNVIAENDPTDFPNSIWGLVGFTKDGSGSGYTMTINQLAYEISLQEGWSATAVGSGFTTDLNEAFNVACSATLKMQRTFGTYKTYPDSGRSASIVGQIGTKIQGLVYDSDTHLPVSTTVQLEDDKGNILSVVSSNASGFFQFLPTAGINVRLRSGPGTTNEFLWPPVFSNIDQYETILSRTVWYLVMPGKPTIPNTESPVPIDVDFIGNQWVTYRDDTSIKIGRKFGAAADWESKETWLTGNRPWLQHYQWQLESPLYLVYTENGTVILSVNITSADTTDWTAMAEIADGDHPFPKFDKIAGILYIAYWRDGAVYMKRTSDLDALVNNQTISFIPWQDGTDEKLVLANAAENTYSFEWLHDNSHSIVMPFMSNGKVISLVSTDHGETWSQ